MFKLTIQSGSVYFSKKHCGGLCYITGHPVTGSVYFSKELCGGLCYITGHPVILGTHIPQLCNNNSVQ